jgi:hypothetical protein
MSVEEVKLIFQILIFFFYCLGFIGLTDQGTLIISIILNNSGVGTR